MFQKTGWHETKDPAALVSEIWQLANHLDVLDSSRRYDMAAYYRLATSHELPFETYGLSSVSADCATPDFSLYQRPTHNVIAECADTLTASVGRNRPWVKAQTNGGDGKLRKRAKNRSRFFDGWAMNVCLYEYTRECFRDALHFGDAFLKVYSVGKDIKVDRVLCTNLRVDPTEARFGKPRTLIQVAGIPRDNLAATYPEMANDISAADLIKRGTSSLDDDTPMVAVLEIWRLPMGKAPGRHVICTNNVVLLDEEWKRETFPFARLQYQSQTAGYWGTGMVEEGIGYQLEIDRLSDVIMTMQMRSAAGHWMVHNGAKVNPDHLGARYMGGVVEWAGQVEPKFVVPQAVPPELYAARQWWIDRARERFGVNQLSSSGSLPPGLKSGEAIRSYNDAASTRHVILGQRLERFVLDIYKLVIQEAAVAKPSVKVPGTNMPLLTWQDCVMKDDEIFEVPFPISALPQQPSGRADRIQEWFEEGSITAVEKMRLTNETSDVIAFADVATSQAGLVEMAIDAMVEDGDYFSPEPYQDLNAALIQAQLRYCSERIRGTSEEALELIRRYIEDIRALGGQPPETQQAGAAASGAPPPDLGTSTADAPTAPASPLASATQPPPQG